MKKAIRAILFGVVVALPGLAQAQTDAKPSLIQQADVLRTYRRIKNDMEEKARNVKEMANAPAKDVDAFEQEYTRLRRDFNNFLAGFSSRVDEANGAPMNLCDLSRAQVDDLMDLYGAYETRFLVKYEDIMGTHETPLIAPDFTATVKNCQPRTAIVQPETYRKQYEPELVVSTWGRL